MENGTRALIMAATVFLGIMLFSIMVYLFRAGAEVNQDYDQKQIDNQLALYNSNFELYNVEDNTIMDIISVANLAYNVNEESDYDSENSMKIEIRFNSEYFNSKTFIIPNTKENGIGRNKIFDNKRKKFISIYDLLEKNITELGINKGIGGLDDMNLNEKLTTTKKDIDTNTPIYKYLFRCIGVEYSSKTGKIKYMKFVGYKNSSWEDTP